MSLLDRAVSLALPAVPKVIVRHFSRRYIAGPTMQDAFRVARELWLEGAMATIDILGELITTAEEARKNTQSYEELVHGIPPDARGQTNISIKLTALGLLIDSELCLNNMRRLLARCSAAGCFARIDMEDSKCTTATLEIYDRLRIEYPGWVGVVLQARLRRTLDDIDRLARQPANFRICKGIYLEPRPIAYTDPEIIRRNFVLALDRMFQLGAYVGVATHDELLVWETLRLIRQYSLGRDRYEFQMLLGVDPSLRRMLLQEGHRLRVYVPYGEQWYQYSVRRLRENPQIAGHALRAMFQRV